MAARIPQLYEPPRKQSSPTPSSPASSSPVNPFASNENLSAPTSNVVRGSTNLSSIGGLLLRDSGSWDPADDDKSIQPVVRGARARASTIVASERYVEVNRAALHARVRDLDSDDGLSDNDMDDDLSDYGTDRDSRINAGAIGGHDLGNLSSGPTQPLNPHRAQTPSARSAVSPVPPKIDTQVQPPTVHRERVQGPASPTHRHHQVQQQQPPQRPGQQYQQQPPQQQSRQNPERPPVVVNFPTPNIVPGASPTWGPPTPTTPSNSRPILKQGAHPGPRPSIQIKLPILKDAQPVAPVLAAPPKAHFSSPMTPPASPSLRGFDSMKEKAATFREDDTEVMNPFSPNARQAGPRPNGRSKLGPGGRKSVYSTVDLWKRFSTMRRVHDSKPSEWMQERKRSVWSKPMFVVPLLLTLIAVGAVVTYLAIKVSHTPAVGDPVPATSSA